MHSAFTGKDIIEEFGLLPAESVTVASKTKHAEPLPAVLDKGNRHPALFSLAGSMRRRNASEEAILAALVAENAKCQPSLDDFELRKLAHGAMKYDPAHEPEETSDFFTTANWSCERFSNSPPNIPQLIDGLLPQSIVSLLYSAGGAGKSTFALDLAIRIALANVHQVYHHGRKVTGGVAAIVTAEDSDLILNHRIVPLCQAIATEYKLEYMYVREQINRHLLIVSTVGESIQLFSLDENGGTLNRKAHFDDLLKYLSTIKNLRFVGIDTKSRFSPGEGAGNVIGTQEIAYYEAIAKATGAVVMLLHHTNKASRNGSMTGQQSYRDASALFDSVRFCWYLRALNSDELAMQGISADKSNEYLFLENSKNNYQKIADPVIIRRFEGWHFETVERKAPIGRVGKSTKERNEIVSLLSAQKEWAFSDIQKMIMTRLGKCEKTAQRWIRDFVIMNLIAKNDGNGTYSTVEPEAEKW